MDTELPDMDAIVESAAKDPRRLQLILEDAGWRLLGGRRDLYVRLAPPSLDREVRQNLVIPFDQDAPEFRAVMRSAIQSVADIMSVGTLVRRIVPRLKLQAMDEIQTRKETASPTGLIKWSQGEEFIACTRSVLTAGAKSFMEPRRVYSNRFGSFANRYLDTVFMGQTEVGSYIVSAFAPTDEPVTLRGKDNQEPANLTATRDITRSVGKALSATVNALDHYRNEGSISGFTEQVSEGISRELLQAVKGIAQNSDEADIKIIWNSAAGVIEEEIDTSVFAFRASDVPVLERAANELAVERKSESVRLQGLVHFLSRQEASSPGTIGLNVIDKEDVNKARVRIQSNEQYHLAVESHDAGRPITVRGNLQREGTLWWIYDAILVDDVATPDGPVQSGGSIEGDQQDLFEDLD